MSLVWIDCEMTGLDTNLDTILEIACVVTTADLVVLGSEFCIIHKSKEVMDGMDKWCVDHHGKSGLTERVLSSTTSTKEAEARILAFVKQHIPSKRTAPLAGNTVYMDKMFLMREMPDLIAHLHYRVVDVSTIKELCRRWNPQVFNKAPRKMLEHRAVDDIYESIAELKHYKQHFFIC